MQYRGGIAINAFLYLFFSLHINAIFLTGTLRDSKRKEIWRAFTSNFKHMMFRGNSQIPPKLDGWVSERKVKIELFFSGLVAASLLAYKTQVSGAPQMIMISMIALAIFYFLSSYLTPDIDGKFGAMACKVLNISSAVCVIGIMFSILKYEGAEQMLIIGTSSLAISGLILVYFTLTSGVGKLGPLLLRIAIIGLIFVALQLP